MKSLKFVDTTWRDGQQSLWATRMPTSVMLDVAPIIEDVGYASVDLMGAVQFDAAVRYLSENPWNRIREIRKLMPNTTLAAGTRSEGLTGFGKLPRTLIALFLEQLVRHGIDEVTLLDSTHDWEKLTYYVERLRKLGAKIRIPLVYSLSPVHTDEYYEGKTQELQRLLKPDIVYLKDPDGILTPDRIQALMPGLLRHKGDSVFELHSHCMTGLAPIVYLEAAKLGVDVLHTAVPPLANGASQPSLFNICANLDIMGLPYEVNLDAAETESEFFRKYALKHELPAGVPVEYDLKQFEHQIPGGMISNLRAMLESQNRSELLSEVLLEIARIRVEWGYPVMVTPFSQIVGTQATLNVLSGQRYKVIPKETVWYILGHYGEILGEVDQDVRSVIVKSRTARNAEHPASNDISIEDLKKQNGYQGVADDEFLLRMLFGDALVDPIV